MFTHSFPCHVKTQCIWFPLKRQEYHGYILSFFVHVPYRLLAVRNVTTVNPKIFAIPQKLKYVFLPFETNKHHKVIGVPPKDVE